MIFVVATRNPGKFREMIPLLSDLPLVIKSLSDFPQIGPIPEKGETFLANAQIKAHTVHRVTGGYVLADDSGLECEDLRGDPGVHSAIWAGLKATDEDNNKKLIEMMQAVHDPSRVARYVCVLVLIDPKGNETIVREECQGMITFTPGGGGGFGYDPYFFIPEKGCTMAELPLTVKNQISHRGKALKKIHAILSKSTILQ